MSPSIDHSFVAELRLAGGRRLRTSPLEIDWVPAIECAQFQAVRRGAAGFASLPRPVHIHPHWDTQDGPPYVAAVRASLDADLRVPDDKAKVTPPDAIPLEYFTGPVRQAVSTLVKTGRLTEGQGYTWRICAFPGDTSQARSESTDPFTIEQVAQGDEITNTCRLRALRRCSVRHGLPRARGVPRDFPVFIDQRVLDEAIDVARAAGHLEAGGILLGRLARSSGRSDLVVEVTAQVPAREAIADDASLRFTPRTWQAVLDALRLRRADERVAGWWHSHPRTVWACRNCPAERRASCPLNHTFFSPMDVAFHRTAFLGPMNVALLFSFHADPLPRHDLFGWRQGLVAAREYYVLEHST